MTPWLIKRVYVIDGADFDTIAGFVAACNRSFIHEFGGDWRSENLDSFNDFLWWGIYLDGHDEGCVLVWRNAEKSRQDFERERGKPGRQFFHDCVEIMGELENVEFRLE